MTISTTTLIFILAPLSLWSCWVFLCAYPAYIMSTTRYRLWRLRDKIVDDMRDGRVRDLPVVRQLRDASENLIRLAPHLTLMLWFHLEHMNSRSGYRGQTKATLDMGGLTEAERSLCRHYQDELIRCLFTLLARTSLLGQLTALALTVLFLLVGFVRKFHQGWRAIDHYVRHERATVAMRHAGAVWQLQGRNSVVQGLPMCVG